MKNLINTLLGLGLSLTITACSLSADVNGKKVAETDIGGGGNSYKYDFTCNECKTGAHSFSSKESYCHALLDEGTNNSCCRRIREDDYKINCQ
ncbi:MAG: hypothetical protein BroJett041_23630 [Candidatus Jettenia caeni]|nr:MAG: hypothetical protein BroJett041_23630 [Candidatus Jettenia caeni]